MAITQPLGARGMISLEGRKSFGVVAVALTGCLLLGGGTKPGFLSDVLLQLLCVPLLAIIIYRWAPLDRASRGGRDAVAAFVILGFLVAIHFVQVVPLPPSVWTMLPNRQTIIQSFELISLPLPWLPISVAPELTWLALLSLLPAVVVFLGSVQLGYPDRRRMALLVLGFGAVSVLLGLLQVAQGEGSRLRPFEATNPTEAVGFFANRNHFAALVYACFVLAAAFAVSSPEARPKSYRQKVGSITPVIKNVVLVTLVTMMILALVVARSRAGFALLALALAGSMFLPVSLKSEGRDGGASSVLVLVSGVVLTTVLVSQFALMRVLERFDRTSTVAARIFAFAQETVEGAMAFMPFGAGVGTFVPVFAMYERTETLHAAYVNRAHNDFLEAWLEMGVAGIVLISAFVLWLLLRSAAVWSGKFAKASRSDLVLARAATLIVALIVAHSVADYPLRTAAISGLFAFCCSLLLPPPNVAQTARVEVEASRAERTTRQLRRSELAAAIGNEPQLALPLTRADFSFPLSSEWAAAIPPPLPPRGGPPGGTPSVGVSPALATRPGVEGAPAPAVKPATWENAAGWPEEWRVPPISLKGTDKKP